MRKQLNIKPAPEILISIDGGEEILLRFNLSAIMALQDMAGGMNNIRKLPLDEFAAMIIASASEEKIDIDTAKTYVNHMCAADIMALVEEFSDSMGTTDKAKQEELAKNAMAQFLASLAK